jgi:hypothetical protein
MSDDDITLLKQIKFVLPADDDLPFSKRAYYVNWDDVSSKLIVLLTILYHAQIYPFF